MGWADPTLRGSSFSPERWLGMQREALTSLPVLSPRQKTPHTLPAPVSCHPLSMSGRAPECPQASPCARGSFSMSGRGGGLGSLSPAPSSSSQNPSQGMSGLSGQCPQHPGLALSPGGFREGRSHPKVWDGSTESIRAPEPRRVWECGFPAGFAPQKAPQRSPEGKGTSAKGRGRERLGRDSLAAARPRAALARSEFSWNEGSGRGLGPGSSCPDARKSQIYFGM